MSSRPPLIHDTYVAGFDEGRDRGYELGKTAGRLSERARGPVDLYTPARVKVLENLLARVLADDPKDPTPSLTTDIERALGGVRIVGWRRV